MAVLQVSTKVNGPVDAVERRWEEFSHTVRLPSGEVDPTVYFTPAAGGTTEVTIQIDPDSLRHRDEAKLTRRVDSLLDTFRDFAEAPG